MSIFAAIDRWNKQGLSFPYAHDPVAKQASVTLFFVYITFLIAAASVIALHFRPELIMATGTSIGFWALAMVFYRLRQLDKAGVNLKTGQITVEDDSDDKNPTPPNQAGS